MNDLDARLTRVFTAFTDSNLFSKGDHHAERERV
jgi:hypothetical protein